LALNAGSPDAQTVDAGRQASQTAASVAADETAPVAVPEPSEKAMRYYRSGNILWFVEQAWTIATLVLLLATGLSAWLRNVARKIGRNWFFTIVVYPRPGLLFKIFRESHPPLGERIDFV